MSAAVKVAPKKDDAAETKIDPFSPLPRLAESESSDSTGSVTPVSLEDGPKKRFDWGGFVALAWAWTKYLVWMGVKAIVAVVCLALMSQGLRHLLPDLGMKLYKLPGLAFLERYAFGYRLDLASIFAVVPLLSSLILWGLILEMFLRPQVFAERFRRWDLDRVKRVILTMGAIIIAGDAGLFCTAVAIVRWGQAKLTPAAFLVTAVYLTVLGFVTWGSLWLKDGIEEVKRNNANKKEEI